MNEASPEQQLALVAPHFTSLNDTNGLFHSTLSVLGQLAAEHHYSLMVIPMPNVKILDSATVEKLNRCRGVILMKEIDGWLTAMQITVPTVGILMANNYGGQLSLVGIDPYAAAQEAVSFFLARGISQVHLAYVNYPCYRLRAKLFEMLWTEAGGIVTGHYAQYPESGADMEYFAPDRGYFFVNRSGSKSTVEPTKWGHTTVKKILTLQEYCGDVINFKSYSKSYKIKRRIENPEENRAIFLNVHEPIIDRATWEKVQALTKGTRRKRPQVTQEPSVFSGYLKCPECGGNLNFHFNQGNHDIKFFSCQNHNSGLRKCSSTHYIRLDFLERVVLYEINRLAAFSSEYEDDFIKAIMGRSAKVAENVRVRKQRELDGLLARDKELDMLFERLYEDNVAGKIDDARFAKMAKRYEQEQGENGKRIKALRLELKQSEGKRMDIDDFLTTVRRYTNATKITKRMVGELIDHIDVYQAEKQDGVTTQRVVIHYNCIGAFDVPDRRKIPEADIIMETRKGVAVSYAPAV